MKTDNNYTVLVHYGTQAWPSVYGEKLTKANAKRLAETARKYGYRDAWIEADYDPKQQWAA